MEHKIVKPKWQKIEDVPVLTYEWAALIAGGKISVEDINDLVKTYEEWLATFTPDGT